MSATNRGSERRTLDAYYTADAVARACVAALPDIPPGGHVLEPHVGGGAFLRAVQGRWADAYTVALDVDPTAAGLIGSHECAAEDFLDPSVPHEPYALIVGNPPYATAEAHIRRALDLVADGGYVAFLLRLAMLESMQRVPLWRDHPPLAVHVLSRRPSFTGGGTDSAAYGFFVWRRGHRGPTALHWLPDWRTA